MSERGSFGKEIRGAYRIVQNELYSLREETITRDQYIKRLLDEDQEIQRLLEGQFDSRIEAWWAYFPLGRERWLAHHQAWLEETKAIDAIYEAQSDAERSTLSLMEANARRRRESIENEALRGCLQRVINLLPIPIRLPKNQPFYDDPAIPLVTLPMSDEYKQERIKRLQELSDEIEDNDKDNS